MLTVHRVAVAVSVGLFGALGLAGDRPQAAAVTYALVVDEVRDLGLLSYHVSSEAHAVSEWGAIAGSSETSAGVRRAVFWPSPDYAPVNLGLLGGGWSEARGINNYSVVVGNSRSTASEDSRGFKWTLNDGMSDLGIIGVGNLKPVKFARVSDINNNGVIVGALGNEFGTSGFLLFTGGALLAPIPYCDNGVRTATVTTINDDDQFTGNVVCERGPWGVPYSAWSLATTTLLPGNESGSDSGYAVNAKNVVVGSISGPPELHAFRWSSSTGQQDIHPPDEPTYASVARGINDHGLVVGHKYTDAKSRAFVYTQGLKMKTLPGLCGWGSWTSESEAYAVNNAGWVVGKSKTCGGDWHATLWKVRVVVRGYIDFP